jgi:hypothetical protein
MQALVAVMRKLLHAVYGLLKYRQPFDCAKLYCLSEPIGPYTAALWSGGRMSSRKTKGSATPNKTLKPKRESEVFPTVTPIATRTAPPPCPQYFRISPQPFSRGTNCSALSR